MNTLIQSVIEKLADFSAREFQTNSGEIRIYLNPSQFKGTKYAKALKLWISFADAATLAGAKLNVRLDIAQHPNWIAAEEEKFRAEFAFVLDAVSEVRQAEGLDEAQEEEAIATQTAINAAVSEAAADEAREAREQAVLDIEIKRIAALKVSEITNAYGNVDCRIPLPAHFTLVKTATEKQLTDSGIEFAKAMHGFSEPTTEKRWSRRGSYRVSVPALPILEGFVILTDDVSKIKTPEQIAAAKTQARKNAEKAAAEKAGFKSVAAHKRHLAEESEKAAAKALKESNEALEKMHAKAGGFESVEDYRAAKAERAKQLAVGKTQTGNIVVRNGLGYKWCLVVTGPQAGKWVEGATFPDSIPLTAIEAESPRAAAALYAQQVA